MFDFHQSPIYLLNKFYHHYYLDSYFSLFLTCFRYTSFDFCEDFLHLQLNFFTFQYGENTYLLSVKRKSIKYLHCSKFLW